MWSISTILAMHISNPKALISSSGSTLLSFLVPIKITEFAAFLFSYSIDALYIAFASSIPF